MSNLFKKIFGLTCIIYAFISIALNIIVWISNGMKGIMLKIGANIIILVICCIISSILSIKNRKKEKNNRFIFAYTLYVCSIYTVSSFIVNVLQYIVKIENFWNGYTVLILLIFSLVSSFLILKIKFKNYLLSSIVYFFVLGIFYYILFIVKTGFSKGNTLLIVLGIYIIAFAIIDTLYYFLHYKRKRNNDNNNKAYNSLF